MKRSINNKTLTRFVAVIASQKQLLLLVITLYVFKKCKTILENCRQVVFFLPRRLNGNVGVPGCCAAPFDLSWKWQCLTITIIDNFYIALFSAFEHSPCSCRVF